MEKGQVAVISGMPDITAHRERLRGFQDVIADAFAMQIKQAFEAAGIPFWVDSFTNQQFVILTAQQKETLAQGYYFEEEATTPQGIIVRFCTSWATTQTEVDALVADIAKL